MSINCRFALDEERLVIDAVNVANTGKAYYSLDCHEGDPEDDKHLRECILQMQLSKMIDKLIINSRPVQKPFAPRNYSFAMWEASFAIFSAMLDTIKASHLNTFDPALSVQHKFDGKLKRQKKHTQDFTSLALFRDDVECLLRDLYGDFESEALDSVVLAVFLIVQQFARYVRPELWKEHDDAEDLDYMFWRPEGCGISGSECCRGMAAKFSLIHRVRELNANQSTVSEYTSEFAKLFAERRDCTKEYVDPWLSQRPRGDGAAARPKSACEPLARLTNSDRRKLDVKALTERSSLLLRCASSSDTVRE